MDKYLRVASFTEPVVDVVSAAGQGYPIITKIIINWHYRSLMFWLLGIFESSSKMIPRFRYLARKKLNVLLLKIEFRMLNEDGALTFSWDKFTSGMAKEQIKHKRAYNILKNCGVENRRWVRSRWSKKGGRLGLGKRPSENLKGRRGKPPSSPNDGPPLLFIQQKKEPMEWVGGKKERVRLRIITKKILQ